jgi:hypothetical protein
MVRLRALVSPLVPAWRRLRDDLDADPVLGYVLLLAALLGLVGIWYRLPNFAGPDEFSRLLHPMEVAGRVAADPSLGALRRGILDGRALGATFYLYGLVLAPMFLVVMLTGRLGTFVALGGLESRWALWQAAPAWFWTGSILLGRLVVVVLGVVSVYLVYRLGVELRDRFAGRMAAALFALSVGFVGHVGSFNEDVPMLCCLLATLLLATRYAETGARPYFLAGALTGGLAVAFKLSGGVAAVALGVAYLDRARRQADPVDALVRPTVLLGGLAVGLAAIAVGIPSVLVGGPGELLTRVAGSIGTKTSKAGGLDAPIAYWFLRQSVRGLGAPVLLAGLLATATAVGRTVARREDPSPVAVLLGASALVFLLVYSRWEFVRLRHLLPIFPVVLLVLGAEASRWRGTGRSRRALRVGLALLLLTSGATVAAAEYRYLTDPRDGATDWLASETPDDATVEVYENSVADVGVPHGQSLSHYPYHEDRGPNTSAVGTNETAYTAWLLSLPERRPDYVQVTAAELRYVSPLNPASERYPERREFVRRLRDGGYDYSRVAAFGDPSRPSSLGDDLVEAAIDPELPGRERYVAVYEREGGA